MKKYISKINNGSDVLYIKDAEAREALTGLSGAMHYIGITTSTISDGSTTNPIEIDGKDKTAVAGDVVVVAGSGTNGSADKEFVFNGTKWQEFGSTGSLKALAFKDSASASYTPAGSNAPSAVSFTAHSTSDFVTGYNNDAVAPSKEADTWSAGSLPSFTEGAFTAASIGSGFFNQGTNPSYSHTGFSGGSLGSATTSTFAESGINASYNEAEETLTFTAASTASAVTAQGAFTPAEYGTDNFNAGTRPSIDLTKFNGGSKAADTFNAGSLPSFVEGEFNAGSAATLKTSKAITALGNGTAAAQAFTGTQATITVQ